MTPQRAVSDIEMRSTCGIWLFLKGSLNFSPAVLFIFLVDTEEPEANTIIFKKLPNFKSFNDLPNK